MLNRVGRAAVAAGFVLLGLGASVGQATQGGPFTTWENGPPDDPAFFPLGVWAQVSTQAPVHADMGMNTFVALGGWRTAQGQLTNIRNAGLYAVAHQNPEMRSLLAEDHEILDTVIAWMQIDEPDNAKRNTTDPDIAWDYIRPPEIQARYADMHANDGTRPVFMNLGQGVGWDGWHGRGDYTGDWWDYPEYQKGADILSFDIYPASSTHTAVGGNLWRVAYGVKRLRQWTDDDKPVWNIIEASPIREGRNEVTPHELRAQAWMSIVHGSTGLAYFVHYWDEDGRVSTNHLASNDVLRPAVTALNAEITGLAPVINSDTIHNRVNVITGNTADAISNEFDIDGIATMLKSDGEGGYYLFTVRMREDAVLGAFQILGLGGGPWEAHVLGEDRVVPLNEQGVFSESYDGWDTKLYHIVPEPTTATLLLAGVGLALARRRRR